MSMKNLNEDDTFETLRRTPLKKLQECMSEDAEGYFESPIFDPFNQFEIDYLQRHGWTVLEFRRSWVKQSLIDNPEIIKYNWWNDFIKSIE